MHGQNMYKNLYTGAGGKPRAKWLLVALLLVLFALFCLALVFYLASHPLKPSHVDLPAPDFSGITVIDERKSAFFNYLSPLVQRQNQRILERRQRIVGIQEELARRGKLSRRSQIYLERMVEAYRFEDEALSVEAQINKLLLRVDMIPVSMVLAQAAMESAWGTSRFATTGNNYFGQWCFRKGCGTVPKHRSEGQVHEVAAFDNARDSVRSYFRNINTHRAYRPVRETRAALREAGHGVVGLELIKGLNRYSERGQEYIDELRQIITGNQLAELDKS
jgi:Bax protein